MKPRIQVRTVLVAAATVLLLGSVAGCAGTTDPNTKTSSAGSTESLGKCGTVPAGPVKDPDGLIPTLPKKLQDYYQGLPYKVQKSAYTDWKPKHAPPYTIGFVNGPLEQPANRQFAAAMQFWADKLKAQGTLKDFIVRAAPDYTVAPQIQQFNSLIQEGVDMILIQPNSTTAFNPAYERAYKAGIPVVTTAGVTESPYVVNFSVNPWLNGATPMAYIAKNNMGGKGNLLLVQGAPTQQASIAGLSGARAALTNCPNIKVVNSTPLTSQYSNSVAKSVVLQFLASYTGTINGVYDGGVVSTGIISAFKQLGKPVPPATNLGAIVGGLAYLDENKDWGSAATGSGGYEYNRLIMNVAIRVLEGKGPKLNSIIGTTVLVTRDNIGEIAAFQCRNGFNASNINVGEVPPFSLLKSSDLDGYFKSPGLDGPPGLDEGEAEGFREFMCPKS